MRKSCIAFLATLLIGSVVARAQTNAFVVSVNGSIIQEDGTAIQVKDVAKGVSGLVPTNSYVLVMFVSKTDNVIELDLFNPATTNIVTHGTLFASKFTAFLDNGKFSCDLTSYPTGRAVTNFPAAIPAFDGSMLMDGKVIFGDKGSVKAKLSGVWKDPNYDPHPGGTNTPAAIFKGTITSIRTNQVSPDCCISF